MTTLVKIGNSQGIRLPKAIIKQAQLQDKILEFEVLKKGLLIKPVENKIRENWKDSIKSTILKNKNEKDEAFLCELLDDKDLEEFQW